MASVTTAGRWTRTAGSLTYIAPRAAPTGLGRGLALVSLAIAALGIVIMVAAGSQMLDGDFTSTGTSRKSGWVTPPLAFGLGLLLALSPFAIWLQEKRLHPAVDDEWDTVVTLGPEGMSLPRSTPPDLRAWNDLTDKTVAEVPERARALVQHYRDHPEDRPGIGTRSSLVRANQTS